MSRFGRLLRTFVRRSARVPSGSRPDMMAANGGSSGDASGVTYRPLSGGPAEPPSSLEDSNAAPAHRPADFGHYRILARLGDGGMGIVYKARDTRLGRLVALKFLLPDASQDQHAIERFRVEARAASALNHPNICTIYDIGDSEHGTYIAMELLEGSSVREQLRSGSLPPARVLKLAIQLADALEAAHSHGIIHRDIKPENLFIVSNDRLKILDFGVAKLQPSRGTAGPSEFTTHTAEMPLTQLGMVVGTTAYMSPEQARGEDVDSRTDLFSFGAVFFEMAARRRAFSGAKAADVHASLLTDHPVLPPSIEARVRTGFQRIVDKALEKRREFRYQHAADLAADLRRLDRDLAAGTLPAADAAHRPPSPIVSFGSGLIADLTRAAAVAIVMFLAYGFFSGRTSGRYLSQFQVAFVQESLQHGSLDESDFEPGGRQLPLVVDISALHPDKRQATDRAVLDALVDGLRKHGARAIGIDLRFDDVHPADFQYFHKWVTNRNVRIGVYRRAVERREAWLGRPEFSSLAAGIALPPDNPQHAFAYSRRWFPGPPASDGDLTTMHDCADQNATSHCKEDLIQLPVALWLLVEKQRTVGEEQSGNDEVEVRLRRLLDARPLQSGERPTGNAIEFGTYVIDYSHLRALRNDVLTIPVRDSGGDYATKLSAYLDAYGSRIADRVVLVGDLEDTEDQFCETQGMRPLSGVLVHACSLATLNRGALLQSTATLSPTASWVLSLLCIAVIVAMRFAYSASRVLQQWPIRQLEILVFTSLAATVIVVCRWQARTSGIVWPNFLWISVALVTYPFAGTFARAFIAAPKVLRAVSRAHDRRVRGG